jgi:hypothetical protein
VFVGQRKEPFYIAVGKIFDLFNLNPLGAESAATRTTSKTRTSARSRSKLPIACLTAARAGDRRLRHGQHAPGDA